MVVVVGKTVFDKALRTEPIELSIDRVVGIPPESVHINVVASPAVMVAGLAVNEFIIGAGGCTITVTDLVTLPVALLAVIV